MSKKIAKKNHKKRSGACITFTDAGPWSADGGNAVADWLRSQANALRSDGHSYAKRTTVRYWYV